MKYFTLTIEEQIVAMYSKGMSTRDIEDHMKKSIWNRCIPKFSKQNNR